MFKHRKSIVSTALPPLRTIILSIYPGEKLRDRLDRLEAIAASVTPANVLESTSAARTGTSEAATPHSPSSTSTHTIAENVPVDDASEEVGSISHNSVETCGSSGPPAHTIADSLRPLDDSDLAASIPSTASLEEFQYLFQQSDDTPLVLSAWDSATISSSSVATPGEHQDLTPPSSDSSLIPSIWDTSTFPSTAAAEYQNHTTQLDNSPAALSIWDPTANVDPSLLVHDEKKDTLGPYLTTTVDCGCASAHIQIQTQGPDPWCHGKFTILNFGPSATAADPYANHLRVETLCNTAALSTLAMCVGITQEMLCADQSLSPFFSSSAVWADDLVKANMVSTVQGVFKILKPDLRPSREQIVIQHHPYIDIIPFPTLRKNLLTHQQDFDEDEVFHDMLTGLVCWGGAGMGRRDRDISTGKASTGTPWDVRSWEARLWFLEKYWSLLGGEDGELVRQSEWWRSMRGDDPVEIEVHG